MSDKILTAATFFQYGGHNHTDFMQTNSEWTSKVNFYDPFLDVWSSDLIGDYNTWPNRTTDYDRLVNQHVHAGRQAPIHPSVPSGQRAKG